MHPDYLEKVLNAQVYDVAIETPLEVAGNLSARVGNRILLKREDLQPVFSFKLRGAYNKIVGLSAPERERGVITASAGNHAQGVALAAQRLQIKALIVMPRTTPEIKVSAVRSRGARVVLHGDTYDEACAHALTLATEKGMDGLLESNFKKSRELYGGARTRFAGTNIRNIDLAEHLLDRLRIHGHDGSHPRDDEEAALVLPDSPRAFSDIEIDPRRSPQSRPLMIG